jgi:hypothetical protein
MVGPMVGGLPVSAWRELAILLWLMHRHRRSLASVQQHLGHEPRVVHHRQVAAAGQHEHIRLRQARLGKQCLVREQQPIARAPGDRHRHPVGDAATERRRRRRGQDLIYGRRGGQEAGHVAAGLLGAYLGWPRHEQGVDQSLAGGTPRVCRTQWLNQPPYCLHDLVHGDRVAELSGARPEPGRGERSDAGCAPARGQLQGHQATQRVPGHVRADEPELVDQPDNLVQ